MTHFNKRQSLLLPEYREVIPDRQILHPVNSRNKRLNSFISSLFKAVSFTEEDFNYCHIY